MNPNPPAAEPSTICWTEGGAARQARWRSEAGIAPHPRVVIADDTLTADAAYRLACEGTALLWRGDFQNAKQLLLAMARRIDRTPRQPRRATAAAEAPMPAPADAFHRHRLAQAQRARTLGRVLVPLGGDYTLSLRRAPDVRLACEGAYGPPDPDGRESLVSLRELLGLIGAHEWRKKGVEVPSLDGPDKRIHPHYGVFAPVRGEYVELVASAPFPGGAATLPLAIDIGTGTGVLAAVLAQRGVARVIATDTDPRALTCARENLARLGLGKHVVAVHANLFPDETAPLIVCNPPWIPARISAPIEGAIFDPDSRMLRGFLAGLAAHLTPAGEGWLILSDIAEHLGLRTRAQLLGYVEQGGLEVLGRVDARPTHKKVSDATDPLHAARAAEVTSLWRLGRR